MSTEVQEVNCSVCLVLEVKDGLNNGADGRVQGRGAQIIVPTSPSSVIKAAQSYPSGFASQHKVLKQICVVSRLAEQLHLRAKQRVVATVGSGEL